jgi:hypothetical protein
VLNVDNIKMDLKEIGQDQQNGLIWFSRDKWQTSVNMVMNLQVPYNIDNLLTTRGIIGFPHKPLLQQDTF